MNKLFSSLLAGLALVGYTSCSQSGYEINITYANPQEDAQTFYLMKGNNTIDSAKITNNKLSFKGQTDSTQVYVLAKKDKGRYNFLTQLFIQNDSKININIDKEIVVDDNNGSNTKYNTFQREFKAANDEAVAKYRKMIADKEDKDKIIEFINKFDEKKNSMWQEALKKNSDNLIGTAILADNCLNIEDYATFKSLLANVKKPELFPVLKIYEEFFNNMENTAEGKMFVDFEGKDLDGNAVKLSDFVGKGKYILVDFWASWCGPCRGEFPNLIAVNKKFGGDKFAVLGINVWDQEKAFKKAMEEEKIDYAQINASKNKEATNLYGIKGIPQIILFAPDGKIVKRNLRGGAIAQTVQEVLNKK